MPTASALAPTALLPPQLQALEQKMEQLPISSERFSEVTRGLVTVTDEGNGKPVGRTKHVSLNSKGEASAHIGAVDGFGLQPMANPQPCRSSRFTAAPLSKWMPVERAASPV
jgi:hypothetical protein